MKRTYFNLIVAAILSMNPQARASESFDLGKDLLSDWQSAAIQFQFIETDEDKSIHPAPVHQDRKSSKRIKLNEDNFQSWHSEFDDYLETLRDFQSLTSEKKQTFIEMCRGQTFEDSLFNAGKAFMFEEFGYASNPGHAVKLWNAALNMGHRDAVMFYELAINQKFNGITRLRDAWCVCEEDQYFTRARQMILGNESQTYQKWQFDADNGSHNAQVLVVLRNNNFIELHLNFVPLARCLSSFAQPQDIQDFFNDIRKLHDINPFYALYPSRANLAEYTHASYTHASMQRFIYTDFEKNRAFLSPEGHRVLRILLDLEYCQLYRDSSCLNIWAAIFRYYQSNPEFAERNIKLVRTFPMMRYVLYVKDNETPVLHKDQKYLELAKQNYEKVNRIFAIMAQEELFKSCAPASPNDWAHAFFDTYYEATDERLLNDFLDIIESINWKVKKTKKQPYVHFTPPLKAPTTRREKLKFYFEKVSIPYRSVSSEEMMLLQYIDAKKALPKSWDAGIVHKCMSVFANEAGRGESLRALKHMVDRNFFQKFDSVKSWDVLIKMMNSSPPTVVDGLEYLESQGIMGLPITGLQTAHILEVFIEKPHSVKTMIQRLKDNGLWQQYLVIEKQKRSANQSNIVVPIIDLFKTLRNHKADFSAYFDYYKDLDLLKYYPTASDLNILLKATYKDLNDKIERDRIKFMKDIGFFEKPNSPKHISSVLLNLDYYFGLMQKAQPHTLDVRSVDDLVQWCNRTIWLNQYMMIAFGCDSPILEALTNVGPYLKCFQSFKSFLFSALAKMH